MDNKERFISRITRVADLLQEPVPGVPLLELLGDDRVLIEHHKGIREYGSERIRIQVSYGQLCVQGQCLVLTRMMKQQLVITGKICQIQLLRGCQ